MWGGEIENEENHDQGEKFDGGKGGSMTVKVHFSNWGWEKIYFKKIYLGGFSIPEGMAFGYVSDFKYRMVIPS